MRPWQANLPFHAERFVHTTEAHCVPNIASTLKTIIAHMLEETATGKSDEIDVLGKITTLTCGRSSSQGAPA
jgi:hypothetical protein